MLRFMFEPPTPRCAPGRPSWPPHPPPTWMGLPLQVAPPLRAAAYVRVCHTPGPPQNSMTQEATGVVCRSTDTDTEKEG